MEQQKNWQQILIEVYKTQWSDIHHSRNQDWELSKIILVGFIGLSGLEIFGKYKLLQILIAIVFAFIGILAIAVTIRHKILFREKMEAIKKIEKELEIDLFESNKKFRLFTTQNFLIAIYSFSTLIFVIFFILALIS